MISVFKTLKTGNRGSALYRARGTSSRRAVGFWKFYRLLTTTATHKKLGNFSNMLRESLRVSDHVICQRRSQWTDEWSVLSTEIAKESFQDYSKQRPRSFEINVTTRQLVPHSWPGCSTWAMEIQIYFYWTTTKEPRPLHASMLRSVLVLDLHMESSQHAQTRSVKRNLRANPQHPQPKWFGYRSLVAQETLALQLWVLWYHWGAAIPQTSAFPS